MDQYAQEVAVDTANLAIISTPGHVYTEHIHQPATRTILHLGCAGCSGSDGCRVRMILEQTAALAAQDRELNELVAELNGAPWWLDMGRIGNFRGGRERVMQLRSDEQERRQAWQSGELHELIGGVLNCQAEGTIDAREAPELTHVGSIRRDEQLPSYTVTTASGFRFEIVDALRKLGGKQIENSDLTILLGKFISRLDARVDDKRTRIQTPDNTMQKAILSGYGTTIFEMRKEGKSRLYFAIANGANGPRITLLGFSGNDEKAQLRAISELCGTEPWSRIN
jgi:hypothetical protein